MRLAVRLNRLEAVDRADPLPLIAEPPTQALELLLDELLSQGAPPEAEHLPEKLARDLLSRDDASPEARETALRYLAGEHDH